MSINSMSKLNTQYGSDGRDLHFDFLVSNGGGHVVTVVASIYFPK